MEKRVGELVELRLNLKTRICMAEFDMDRMVLESIRGYHERRSPYAGLDRRQKDFLWKMDYFITRQQLMWNDSYNSLHTHVYQLKEVVSQIEEEIETIEAEERALAIAMSSHPRLGDASPLRSLPEDILQLICSSAEAS